MSDHAPKFVAQVLVVDDEEDHAEVMGEALRRLGHVCTLVHDESSAMEELRHGQFDLIVTDLVMDGEDAGMRVLSQARQSQPEAEAIMVTAHGDVPRAKAAIQAGAFDFIEKPLDLELLRNRCTKAIETVLQRTRISDLEERMEDAFGVGGSGAGAGIIGNSSAIRQVVQTIKQVAPSNIPVLITGESGTGKELVANAIHQQSKRARQRFVPVNCAGLTESILEDELFGHVRGAFTGADKDREGRFEYADKGTLFLDEVGDMPTLMQAKLLRVLENGEVVRLGSNEPRRVDVRLVSATNRDLPSLVREGGFREDLFYRIKVAQVHMPALRERREDIPLLVHFYVRRFADQIERAGGPPAVAEDVQLLLQRHDWPGNVRQLMNAVQNMVVICEGDRIEMRHVPPEVRSEAGGESGVGPGGEGADRAGSGATAGALHAGLSLDQLEKQAIRDALKLNHGNREAAAKMLGIGERTLYRKLKEYGLR